MATKTTKAKQVFFYGTGRRKNAVACVRIVPGKGNVTVNGRELEEYFGLETLKIIVKQPLVLTATEDKFDLICKAVGGGLSGQAGAIRHGLSRALLKADDKVRLVLKEFPVLGPGSMLAAKAALASRAQGMYAKPPSEAQLREMLEFACGVEGL